MQQYYQKITSNCQDYVAFMCKEFNLDYSAVKTFGWWIDLTKEVCLFKAVIIGVYICWDGIKILWGVAVEGARLAKIAGDWCFIHVAASIKAALPAAKAAITPFLTGTVIFGLLFLATVAVVCHQLNRCRRVR